MIKRVIGGVKRRIDEYRVKRNFADAEFSQPEFQNKNLFPEFYYRDDNSTYVSSFIRHEETDVTPWDEDNKSDKTRISYTDSAMRLFSKAKKENWMCFFLKDVKEKYSFSFDIEDHSGLDEIQVSFNCSSLKDRYRFMIRNNKTAVFEVVRDGRFYRYVKQKSCEIPLNEKHSITVTVDKNRYSLSVDKEPVISVRERKNLLGSSGNNMIMIFYRRDGEINCDVSSVVMED